MIKRKSDLKKAYGITLERYDEILAAQNGVCAICERKTSGGPSKMNYLHVDHCHDTKQVRGLLCHKCNIGIGHLNHDPITLVAALKYLGYSL